MNKKLLIVFLILMIIPVGLLGWLGFVSARMEKERSFDYAASSAGERLETIKSQIENTFSGIEGELLGLPDISRLSIEDIRGLGRKNGFIRQIFVMKEDGSLRYPAEIIPLSRQEEDFLTRTQEIGLSPGLFLITPEDPGLAPKEKGWYTWYLGEGTNFIFWKKEGTEIIGFELNRPAVISAVIRNLPDTGIESTSPFRVVLKDGLKRTVYQWGGYIPPDNASAAASLSSAEPLQGWRLVYYLNPDSIVRSGPGALSVYISIAAAVLAVIGLSLYLYRESTREVREAYRKVSFVNQVSHELKTPLTNIRMYAELLENRLPEDDEKAGNYLGVLVSESRRLSRLIGNVLTFAKEKKSGIPFNPAPVSVDRVVRSVLDNFSPSLQAKKIIPELSLNCEREVTADRDILEQIISNLLSNVAKYAFSGGFLKIETSCEGDVTVIVVRDKGPGIPSASREKVFKPFYRLSNKLNDGAAGTGIGLSIVRTLAGIHGGSAKILPSKQGAAVKITLRTKDLT